MVVDNDCKLIGDQIVLSEHDKVARLTFQAVRLLTLNEVVEAYFGVVGAYSERRFSGAGAVSTRPWVDRA